MTSRRGSRLSTPVKAVLIILGSVVTLGAVAVIALVVFVTIENRPPKVPDGFDAPAELAAPSGAAGADAFFYDSDRTGNFEVYIADEPGGEPVQLTDDPRWDSWWPRLSPDRRRVLFYRSPVGVHDTDFGQTHLWMMNADGTDVVELRPPGLDGWAQQGHAEWSPDATQLVMFGGKKTNPQIYLTDVTGQGPIPVTDRGGTNIDPSFSPDGSGVVFIGCPESFCTVEDYEVYLVDITDVARGGEPGEVERITDDQLRDHDPYFAPDGTKIAWLTQTSSEGRHPGGSWNVRIADPDGSSLDRLTDDDQINSKPEWSRDSSTIYFHRLEMPRLEVFSIFAIDRDGTNLREITVGQPGVNEFPST